MSGGTTGRQGPSPPGEADRVEQVELADWLDTASPRTGGFRDDFFLKVTAAARAGSAALIQGVLAKQRAHLLRELRNLDGLRRSAADPVVALLLAAAVRHVEADLAFVGDAEAALLADGGTTLAALMPVHDEKPLSESA